MTTIIRFIEKAGLAGVFDDHATKVMGEAFDAACKDLHDTGQSDLALLWQIYYYGFSRLRLLRYGHR